MSGTHVLVSAEQVFREHLPRVFRLARRVLGNDADAEDVTSEVLLQVVRKLDTFRGEAFLGTWLHRVTINTAVSFRRRCDARRERQAAGRTPGRPAPRGPVQQALDRELAGLVEAAVAALPAAYRDVFELSEVEGLPDAAVAMRLGLSVPAVKARMHRARLLMRRALAPHLGEPGA